MTESLTRERRKQCNILRTIEALNICIPALRLFCKVESQLKAGRFYSVIKTLEELELQHLSHILPFRFGKAIEARIPHVRAQVRREAFDDMRRFPEEVQQKAGDVGDAAMAQVATRHSAGADDDAVDGNVPALLNRQQQQQQQLQS